MLPLWYVLKKLHKGFTGIPDDLRNDEYSAWIAVFRTVSLVAAGGVADRTHTRDRGRFLCFFLSFENQDRSNFIPGCRTRRRCRDQDQVAERGMQCIVFR